MSGLSAGSRIALLTSGGDAPGMNAALRGAARVAAALGYEVLGVEEGYRGLIEGAIVALDLRQLDEAARRGGTLLGTARSRRFPTEEGQAAAQAVLEKERISAVVVIGGNGSLTGAQTLERMRGADGPVRVVGVPASIDNDLACTSMSIGVDTAMNTIVEACDRICDTAAAHRRTFIIEVMGRDCGYLAMTAGIAAGADAVLVPEVGLGEAEIVDKAVRAVEAVFLRGTTRRRCLILKAEGVKMDAARLKVCLDDKVREALPDVDSRVTVLGHVVRGGAPTAFDRLLGARLANCAVRALAAGQSGIMVGWVGPGIAHPPSPWDPYVVVSPLAEALAETDRLMRGESDLARWRKRTFAEIDRVLLL